MRREKHKKNVRSPDAPVSPGHLRRERKKLLDNAREQREILLRAFRKLEVFRENTAAYRESLVIKDVPLNKIKLDKASRLDTEFKEFLDETKGKMEALGRTEQISWPDNGRSVVIEKPGENPVIETVTGEKLNGTSGQLSASILWGENYRFDSRTPTDVQMEIFMYHSSMAMWDKVDRIQALLETANWHNLGGDARLAEAFEAKEERWIKSPSEWPSGVIAEKMANSLLMQVIEDSDTKSIAILSAPPTLDVSHKIDFIVHKGGKNYGIQFVSSENEELLEKKRRQLLSEKDNVSEDAYSHMTIKDIYLVAVDMSNLDLKKIYREWNANKEKLVGGPEQLLGADLKRKIVERCMEHFLDSESLAKMVEKTQPQT